MISRDYDVILGTPLAVHLIMKILFVLLALSLNLNLMAQEKVCEDPTSGEATAFSQEILDAVSGARVAGIDQMLSLTDILNDTSLRYNLSRGPESCYSQIRWDP